MLLGFSTELSTQGWPGCPSAVTLSLNLPKPRSSEFMARNLNSLFWRQKFLCCVSGVQSAPTPWSGQAWGCPDLLSTQFMALNPGCLWDSSFRDFISVSQISVLKKWSFQNLNLTNNNTPHQNFNQPNKKFWLSQQRTGGSQLNFKFALGQWTTDRPSRNWIKIRLQSQIPCHMQPLCAWRTITFLLMSEGKGGRENLYKISALQPKRNRVSVSTRRHSVCARLNLLTSPWQTQRSEHEDFQDFCLRLPGIHQLRSRAGEGNFVCVRITSLSIQLYPHQNLQWVICLQTYKGKFYTHN